MINKVYRKICNWLVGSSEIKYLETQLKNVMQDCKSDEERNTINQIRRKLHFYRMKRERRVGTGILVIGVLCLLLLAGFSVKALVSGLGNKKKPVEVMTEVETESESESETEPGEPVEILLSFTGDCILGTDESFYWDTGFNAYYENYGGKYFFDNVRDIFQKDDLTVINMEGTLTNEQYRVEKEFAFKGDPEFIDILTSSSIEAANVANNHSHDYGEQSFIDTVELLEKNGIPTFGYDDVKVLDVKGVKVGLFGIYELDDHLERIPQVKSNIAKLKEQGADVIVAVFHWSNELVTIPDENQLTLGHLAIDEGADLVIGHHPHILQGIENYKGKNIVYSLGNFCFGGNVHPTEMDTMIYQQKFVVQNGKIIESDNNLIPCCVSSTWEYNDYKPTVLKGEEAQEVLDKIKERSEGIPITV